MTLYFDINNEESSIKEKQIKEYNLQILRGFCDLIFDINYYNMNENDIKKQEETNTILTAILQNLLNLQNIIQKPSLLITPSLFYKYCKLNPYIQHSKDINLIKVYKELLITFFGYNHDLLKQYVYTTPQSNEDKPHKIKYADLLLKICFSFIIENYEKETPIHSTENINVLLSLYFEKEINLKIHLSSSHLSNIKELFHLFYEDNNSLLQNNTFTTITFKYMLFLLLHFLRRDSQELETYFSEHQFIYTQNLFKSLLLHCIKCDNKVQYTLSVDINYSDIQLESYDDVYIYTIFKIACNILLDYIRLHYSSNNNEDIIENYHIIHKFINALINSNRNKLKNIFFSNESFLSLFYERYLCLTTKQNSLNSTFISEVFDDFISLSKQLLNSYDNLFLINTLHDIIYKNDIYNKDYCSQIFFQFIDQMTSLKYENSKKIFHKNLLYLLQKIYLLFNDATISNSIIRNKNNIFTLCSFFTFIKEENLLLHKIGLEQDSNNNTNIKLHIEIIFELLSKCYSIFLYDDIILVFKNIMNNNNKNILIYLDNTKTINQEYKEYPHIMDVNISIVFIIKLYKLISLQDQSTQNIKLYFEQLQDDIISSLSNDIKSKSFYHYTKNKLYNNICSIFEDNIKHKIQLNELKAKIMKLFTKYETKKEINIDEYDCFKLSKVIKNNKNNIPNRSISTQEIMSVSSNSNNRTSSSFFKRNRILSDDTKDNFQYRTTSDIENTIRKVNNETTLDDFTLEEYDLELRNEIENEINDKMDANINNDNNINENSYKIIKEKICNIEKDDCNNDNNYSFNLITIDNTLQCPKKEILLSYFSMQFKDVYFYNDTFVKMKLSYPRYMKGYTNLKLLNFPSKIKNFSNSLEPPPFLKQANPFFSHKYFHISHSYINKESIPLTHIPFQRIFPFTYSYEHIFECELLSMEYSSYGHLKIFNNYLEFTSDDENDPRYMKNRPFNEKYIYFSSRNEINLSNKKKHIIIFYSEIKELLVKRFLYLFKAFELFCNDGKSYFFNLLSIQEYISFINILKQKVFPNNKIIDTSSLLKSIIKDYKSKWEKKLISTYHYLLYLNKYSTRTFKDGNQYPIFPWILKDFSNIMNPYFGFTSTHKTNINPYLKYIITINPNIPPLNTEASSFRNMSYPISFQEETKRTFAIERYKELKSSESYAYHSGSHYSTSSFILYYLMRQLPFTNLMITLQNGTFETPNRMFVSFNETQRILKTSNDNRELIPEMFSSIYFMLNLNYCYFGKTILKEQVNHLQILSKEIGSEYYSPNNIGSYVQYILMHRRLLNSVRVRKDIGKWIDYIFGCNQFVCNENGCNVFAKSSYAQVTNFEEKIKKLNAKFGNGSKEKEIRLVNKVNIVLSFGQCPFQVLEGNHAAMKISDINMDMMNKDMIDIGIYNKKYVKEKYKGSFVYVKLLKKNELCVVTNKGNVVYYTIVGTNIKKEEEYNVNIPLQNQYRIEHSFIFNMKYIISVNHVDNSIRFYNCKTKLTSCRFVCNDYICSICKLTNDEFITGHKCGMIMHWKYKDDTDVISMQLMRFVYAHQLEVTVIKYHSDLNIILTAGNDNSIYIRKEYDFEMLSELKISDANLKIVNFEYTKLNMVYALCYDKEKGDNIVIGFTFNGIEFARSERGVYGNIDVTYGGNVIVNDVKEKKIKILKGGELDELGCFELKNYNNDFAWICYRNRQMFMALNNDEDTLVGISFDDTKEEYILFDSVGNEFI